MTAHRPIVVPRSLKSKHIHKAKSKTEMLCKKKFEKKISQTPWGSEKNAME